MSKNIRKGQCLCGVIKLSVLKFLSEGLWFCHCTRCRKNYGMYGAFVGASKDDMKVTGEKNICWYKTPGKGSRGFCKKCGSGIFWEFSKNKNKNIYILAGLFDRLRVKKGRHIFVENKGDYYTFQDKLPKFKNVPK